MTTEEQKYLYNLGRNIAKYRKLSNMTQLDVCAEINMERNNLSAIENGRQNVTTLTLYKIAKAINIDIQLFFNAD